MSASERLKALDGQLAPRDAWLVDEDGTIGLAGGNMLAAASLRRALPQIVAVVEWAEKFSNFNDYHAWTNKEHPRLEPSLDAALAALDEALS